MYKVGIPVIYSTLSMDATNYELDAVIINKNGIVLCCGKMIKGYGQNRPTASRVNIGTEFFDTTLGKPIWAKAVDTTNNTVTWVDANGAEVL
jgi:hypothetical protein